MTEELEKEIVLDEKRYLVTYTLTKTFECESDYGADADGNRGEHACFINKEDIEDVSAEFLPEDEQLDPVPVTDPELLKKLEDELL